MTIFNKLRTASSKRWDTRDREATFESADGVVSPEWPPRPRLSNDFDGAATPPVPGGEYASPNHSSKIQRWDTSPTLLHWTRTMTNKTEPPSTDYPAVTSA